MVDASTIREHMEVVASNGIHLGTVDRVEGDSIKLTRDDPDANGRHHTIPLSWVEEVADAVRLNKEWGEAKWEWTTVPQSAGG
jgi:hypothetical protein